MLHDGRLHFGDIAAARTGAGGLAFPSACGTARSRLDLPDESLNLLSAFQLAGYTQLVGSLWPVSDRASVRLAEAFYERLTSDPDSGVAHALHHAVSRLRARRRCGPPTCTSGREPGCSRTCRRPGGVG